jgi:hypothetical protein
MELSDKFYCIALLLFCIGFLIMLISGYWVFDIKALPVFPKIMLYFFGCLGIAFALWSIYAIISMMKQF